MDILKRIRRTDPSIITHDIYFYFNSRYCIQIIRTTMISTTVINSSNFEPNGNMSIHKEEAHWYNDGSLQMVKT